MSGMPGTRLRTSLVGSKEMALGHLVFILGRGRYQSLGISDRGDETAADMEEEEEDGRSRLTSAFTAVPHIHKMTPRGEKIVLFICLSPFHISCQQHSSISVISQGAQTCLAIHSSELYFNARTEGGQIAGVNSDLCPLSLSCRRHSSTARPPPPGPCSHRHPRRHCLVSVACQNVLTKEGSIQHALKIHFQLPLDL